MFVLLAACSGPGQAPPPGGTDAGDLTGLEITVSEVVPTTFELTWTTTTPGQSWVEFGELIPGEARTEPTVIATSDHRVRIAGLKAGHSSRWRAVTKLADGSLLVSGENEVEVDPTPPGLPRLTLAAVEPDSRMADGYLVTALIESEGGWVVVLDGDADIVWWFDTGHAGSVPPDLVDFVPPEWNGQSIPVTSRIDVATRSVLVQFFDGQQAVDVATLRRIPIDAMTVDEIVTTRTDIGHHDFVYHPTEGTVGWLAYQVRENQGTGLRWASDAIVEADEGSTGATGIRPVWSWLDDFPQEPFLFDPLQENFAVTTIADIEWTHSNSLMYDAGSDSYFLMSKFLDCLVKIDRQTGQHDWVMGGMFSDFTLVGGGPVWTDLRDTRLWSHAHMSEVWYDAATGRGGLVVFDNGYYYPDYSGIGEGWSRVAELEFDEQARTVSKVWEYIEPSGAFTGLMGDVRRMDSGAYLVGWSTVGRIEEITPQGDIAWQALTPLGSIMGRVTWYDSFPP